MENDPFNKESDHWITNDTFNKQKWSIEYLKKKKKQNESCIIKKWPI